MKWHSSLMIEKYILKILTCPSLQGLTVVINVVIFKHEL